MGAITDKLFGNNIPDEVKNPRVTSFTAPGLHSRFSSPYHVGLGRGPGVDKALGGISSAFQTQADEIEALQPLVEPGFGRLTEAGINAVRDARRVSMGDLKTNLARRRVRGSSFGADDINRTNAEFAKRENEFGAQAFTQELALSNNLINQKATARANSFMQNLSQFNVESGLAAQIASGVTTVLSGNAKIMADMSNAGANAILGTLGSGFGMLNDPNKGLF